MPPPSDFLRLPTSSTPFDRIVLRDPRVDNRFRTRIHDPIGDEVVAGLAREHHRQRHPGDDLPRHDASSSPAWSSAIPQKHAVKVCLLQALLALPRSASSVRTASLDTKPTAVRQVGDLALPDVNLARLFGVRHPSHWMCVQTGITIHSVPVQSTQLPTSLTQPRTYNASLVPTWAHTSRLIPNSTTLDFRTTIPPETDDTPTEVRHICPMRRTHAAPLLPWQQGYAPQPTIEPDMHLGPRVEGNGPFVGRFGQKVDDECPLLNPGSIRFPVDLLSNTLPHPTSSSMLYHFHCRVHVRR